MTWIWEKKGTLCGRGDTSMFSFIGAGDEDGNGGVVQYPVASSQY